MGVGVDVGVSVGVGVPVGLALGDGVALPLGVAVGVESPPLVVGVPLSVAVGWSLAEAVAVADAETKLDTAVEAAAIGPPGDGKMALAALQLRAQQPTSSSTLSAMTVMRALRDMPPTPRGNATPRSLAERLSRRGRGRRGGRSDIVGAVSPKETSSAGKSGPDPDPTGGIGMVGSSPALDGGTGMAGNSPAFDGGTGSAGVSSGPGVPRSFAIVATAPRAQSLWMLRAHDGTPRAGFRQVRRRHFRGAAGQCARSGTRVTAEGMRYAVE